jgi:hypothetical protein
MTKQESNELIIRLAQKCNTYFTIKELKENFEKEGYSLSEQQIRNRVNFTKSFEFDKKTKFYRIKINKANNKIIKASDMKIMTEQYFLDKANSIVERELNEASNKAKNGERYFVFTLPDEIKVVEIIKNRLIELEYQIEISNKEMMFYW